MNKAESLLRKIRRQEGMTYAEIQEIRGGKKSLLILSRNKVVRPVKIANEMVWMEVNYENKQN